MTNMSVLTRQNHTNDTRTDIGELRGYIDRIESVVCPVLFTIGVAGNACILMTVLHERFRKMTSRFILCALAVSDTLLLSTNPFNQNFMISFFGQDIRALSPVTCKLFFIVYRVAKISSSWFIVMLAGERFIAVLWPLKVRSILRKRNTYIMIESIYIVVLMFSGMWSITTNVDSRLICRPDVVTPQTLHFHKVAVVVGACLFSIVPFSILLCLTPLTIFTIVYKHRIRARIQHRNRAKMMAKRATSRISLMLISVVVTYLILAAPITVVLIITVWTGQPIFGSSDRNMIMLQAVGLSLEELNHACNFVIYILLSTQFRNQFLQIIQRKQSRNLFCVKFKNDLIRTR